MDFAFLGEPSEEQKAEIRKRRQLQEMAMEEGTQRVNNLIDSLDAEQLKTLKGMLNLAINMDGYGLHMIGWIGGLMHFKHGVCPGCGSTHETPEELLAAHENLNEHRNYSGD